jgi:hypothetical protein
MFHELIFPKIIYHIFADVSGSAGHKVEGKSF